MSEMDLNTCHTRLIAFFVCWLELITVLAGITLTATPSSDVEVNQVVSLQCLLEQTTHSLIIVVYKLDTTVICTLEPNNGTCKKGCPPYNVSCPSKTMFNLQASVPLTWNGKSITCTTTLQLNASNPVQLSVKVPVKKVTMMTPTPTVFAGEEINLTCTTSDCNPPAIISWNMSMTDITNQSIFEINASDNGLSKTTSFLQIQATKLNNENQVFCTASNIPSQNVYSRTYLLNVYYKPEVKSITPNPYTIKEGHNATLVCTITDANPSSGITWKWFNATRSNSKIIHNGSNYTIPDVVRTNAGSYSCTARNVAGPSEKVTIFVDVHYKPDVTTNISNPYKVIEGQDATLTCSLTAANPKSDIRWKWFKSENPSITLYNGPLYAIPIIHRTMSGSYICTASNSAGTSENVQIQVDVQYPPVVKNFSKQEIIEGRNLSIICQANPGNPNSTFFTWTMTNNPSFREDGASLQFQNIQRVSSGNYTCTGENRYSNREKGRDNQTMVLNVLYKPKIVGKASTTVNERDSVILSQEIDSNPLAEVSWYDGSELLKTQPSARNATLIIKKASCSDTKNFTLLASNAVENVTTLVELIVNCKPRSYNANITLGVTDTTGIEFSTTIIAYPEPGYELQNGNGTKINQMTDSIITNSMFNFTIHFNQSNVKPRDYGTYFLRISNSHGNTTVVVNIISQRRPISPKIIGFVCESTRARIQWLSSFNGGDPQLFVVVAINSQNKRSQSDIISDKGENQMHSIFVQNLQSSTTYLLYVSAENSHGVSSSENISCTTEESSDNLPILAGSAAAGGITLAVIVIVIVVLFQRNAKHEKHAGQSQRLKNEVAENEEENDDGMKDNILYVSAGPNVDDKPEAAVYAAVNKKTPESNNNANVYAEVNKSGHVIVEGAMYNDVKPKKGLFKKDVNRKKGGNPKQTKGKKQKTKQDVADVYENSEEIAMSSKSDNVYSNAGQKVHNEDERGYKNKDGLLYVEVQFDAKTEKGNQTIHGEDEKTDYATVEFPMAASTPDECGNEKI